MNQKYFSGFMSCARYYGIDKVDAYEVVQYLPMYSVHTAGAPSWVGQPRHGKRPRAKRSNSNVQRVRGSAFLQTGASSTEYLVGLLQ